MSSKYSNAALEKASGIFLPNEEFSECLELSPPLVAGKGFSAVRINLSLRSPSTALAVVMEMNKNCKLQLQYVF